MSPLENLADEVLLSLLRFLDKRSICAVARASRRLSLLCKDQALHARTVIHHSVVSYSKMRAIVAGTMAPISLSFVGCRMTVAPAFMGWTPTTWSRLRVLRFENCDTFTDHNVRHLTQSVPESARTVLQELSLRGTGSLTLRSAQMALATFRDLHTLATSNLGGYVGPSPVPDARTHPLRALHMVGAQPRGLLLAAYDAFPEMPGLETLTLSIRRSPVAPRAPRRGDAIFDGDGEFSRRAFCDRFRSVRTLGVPEVLFADADVMRDAVGGLPSLREVTIAAVAARGTAPGMEWALEPHASLADWARGVASRPSPSTDWRAVDHTASLFAASPAAALQARTTRACVEMGGCVASLWQLCHGKSHLESLDVAFGGVPPTDRPPHGQSGGDAPDARDSPLASLVLRDQALARGATRPEPLLCHVVRMKGTVRDRAMFAHLRDLELHALLLTDPCVLGFRDTGAAKRLVRLRLVRVVTEGACALAFGPMPRLTSLDVVECDAMPVLGLRRMLERAPGLVHLSLASTRVFSREPTGGGCPYADAMQDVLGNPGAFSLRSLDLSRTVARLDVVYRFAERFPDFDNISSAAPPRHPRGGHGPEFDAFVDRVDTLRTGRRVVVDTPTALMRACRVSHPECAQPDELPRGGAPWRRREGQDVWTNARD